MQGRLISNEGLDGSGKSVNVPWLHQFIQEQGIPVVLTREPGGTPLGEKLRAMMLHEQMDARTEALLMHAARIEHIEQVIRPALASGTWVITDRFSDSSYAYQAFGRHVGTEAVQWLEQFACGTLEPDLTFFFDLDPSIAKERRERSRSMLDRFEKEDADFFERTRDGYIWRANANPHRFAILNGAKSIEEVRIDIESHIRLQINDWIREKNTSMPSNGMAPV